jgi:hypothetical protein
LTWNSFINAGACSILIQHSTPEFPNLSSANSISQSAPTSG